MFYLPRSPFRSMKYFPWKMIEHRDLLQPFNKTWKIWALGCPFCYPPEDGFAEKERLSLKGSIPSAPSGVRDMCHDTVLGSCLRPCCLFAHVSTSLHNANANQAQCRCVAIPSVLAEFFAQATNAPRWAPTRWSLSSRRNKSGVSCVTMQRSWKSLVAIISCSYWLISLQGKDLLFTCFTSLPGLHWVIWRSCFMSAYVSWLQVSQLRVTCMQFERVWYLDNPRRFWKVSISDGSELMRDRVSSRRGLRAHAYSGTYLAHGCSVCICFHNCAGRRLSALHCRLVWSEVLMLCVFDHSSKTKTSKIKDHCIYHTRSYPYYMT